MRVHVQMGYRLYLAELSGAELEVLVRIAGKMFQVEDRYLEADVEVGRPDGRYVHVMPEGPEQRPEFKIEVVTDKPLMRQGDFDHASKKAG